MTQLKPAEKATTAAYDKVKAKTVSVTEQVFQLYSNLIAEKARQPWTKIISEQINAAPWNDIQGVEHSDKPASCGNPSWSL